MRLRLAVDRLAAVVGTSERIDRPETTLVVEQYRRFRRDLSGLLHPLRRRQACWRVGVAVRSAAACHRGHVKCFQALSCERLQATLLGLVGLMASRGGPMTMHVGHGPRSIGAGPGSKP